MNPSSTDRHPRCHTFVEGNAVATVAVGDSGRPPAQATRAKESFDCMACGACCREAFDRVGISMRDPVVWRHPDLVVRTGPRFYLARADGRCAALTNVGEAGGSIFRCVVYDERPQPCRDFVVGSVRCLEARCRVGLDR